MRSSFAPANAQKNWLVAAVCAGSKRLSVCGIGALVGATLIGTVVAKKVYDQL
jgi:hypothetical protein